MSDSAINRRQFLRGDFSGTRRAVRPPWAVAEARFVDRCDRCGNCVSACVEKILQLGRDGLPYVDFSRGECTFCGECAARCQRGAFTQPSTPPWRLKAVISDSCLPRRGVVCRSCAEQCESAAIRFRPMVGGVSIPELTAGSCNGCGACYRPCPVGAISLQYREADVDQTRASLSVGASV